MFTTDILGTNLLSFKYFNSVFTVRFTVLKSSSVVAHLEEGRVRVRIEIILRITCNSGLEINGLNINRIFEHPLYTI